MRAFVDNDEPALAAAEMLPSRLAQACAAVLPVDGVGLSVFHAAFRVPLGASDATSCDAERLQFTLGEGPCLQAHSLGTPVRADFDHLRTHWPLLHAELVGATPYRSVVALPLTRVTAEAGGAVDLYFVDPDQARSFDLAEAEQVAAQIVETLDTVETVDEPMDLPGPAWMYGPGALARMQVWVAIGMVNVALRCHDADALALLRAYAYSHDTSLDHVSAAVVERELSAVSLRH